MRLIAAILVVAFSGAALGQDFGGHALFVRTADADAGKKKEKTKRKNYARKDPTSPPRARSARSERDGTKLLLIIVRLLMTNKWFEIR